MGVRDPEDRRRAGVVLARRRVLPAHVPAAGRQSGAADPGAGAEGRRPDRGGDARRDRGDLLAHLPDRAVPRRHGVFARGGADPGGLRILRHPRLRGAGACFPRQHARYRVPAAPRRDGRFAPGRQRLELAHARRQLLRRQLLRHGLADLRRPTRGRSAASLDAVCGSSPRRVRERTRPAPGGRARCRCAFDPPAGGARSFTTCHDRDRCSRPARRLAHGGAAPRGRTPAPPARAQEREPARTRPDEGRVRRLRLA